MDSYLLGIITAVITAVIGAWLSSVEWRMKQVREMLDRKPSRSDLKEYVELSQKDIRTLQEEIKEDIKRLETKLDKLLDR